jgi:release factor glutamine methyltransferase
LLSLLAWRVSPWPASASPPARARAAAEALWRRRLVGREPLQYLTSTAFWRDMVLSVGPGVLIPRPETELIVDFALDAAAARPQLGRGAWADLGTGSGALALGIARALPAAPAVWAVDLAAEPVAHAAANAARAGVGHRVRVVRGSWFEPLLAAGMTSLAGIVSNPPYIASADMAGLQAEVGRHEPALALDGGGGLGIDSLMKVCLGAAALLQGGGFLALETAGGEQAEYIADVLRRMRDPGGGGGGGGEGRAFEEVQVRQDLRAVGRFVTATRCGQAEAM